MENTGRYTRGFLNTFAGEGTFRVHSEFIRDLTDEDEYKRVIALLDDPDLGFAYVSDTKITFVYFEDYPGWMNFCQPLGITITPSAKVAKRVTMMTRLVYLYALLNPGDITMSAVSNTDYTVEDTEGLDPDYTVRFLDGANVISRELLEIMITNGSSNIPNPWDKNKINRNIDTTGSFSLRISTPEGEIKGDCFVADRDSMGGYDVLYHEGNIKREFKTDRIFVLAEPHSEAGPVWSDDQSMSWLGQWLYPDEMMVDCLTDMGEITYQELASNIYPHFFTDTSVLGEDSLITQFQSQAVRWHRDGLGLDQSIFLLQRIAQGFTNLLMSKRRWPIPCAMYAHVATDSWLAMAGYEREPTERGTVWFHEETQRLVYNDLDFAELYNRHGGWDLDDSIKAMFRMWQGRKVVVTVRSPNSFGEYDIKDYVEGTYFPRWKRADGTFMEFPEVPDERPAFLEELDITYSGLPTAEASKYKEYSKEMVREAIDTALRSQGVFGRRANADMVYFQTFSDYRRDQLAPIEAIIDACTQEQTEEALILIDQDTEDILNAVICGGKPVDRTMWQRRIGRCKPGVDYKDMAWTRLCATHDIICSVYQARMFELAQACRENIDPDVLDLGKLYKDQGKKLIDWYYACANMPGERTREFYLSINEKMTATVTSLERHKQHNLVFAMARQCYSRKHGTRFSDTPLFQAGRPGENSIFDIYIDAIQFYQIGKKDWSTELECVKCEGTTTTTDRLDLQMALFHKGICAGCR